MEGGSHRETQSWTWGSSAFLAPSWSIHRTFLRTCNSPFAGLSQAGKAPADREGLQQGGEKGEKLPEILPPPSPSHSRSKAGQKSVWEAEGLWATPNPAPVPLGTSLCLSRPCRCSRPLFSLWPLSPDYAPHPIRSYPFPSLTLPSTWK